MIVLLPEGRTGSPIINNVQKLSNANGLDKIIEKKTKTMIIND